jgi:hypothetical protein
MLNLRLASIPSNGDYVLKVDPVTSALSYIGERMPGGYKWCAPHAEIAALG